MALTGETIKSAIQDIDNIDEFCDRLAQAIVANLEVRVPASQVIVQVTGGGGAPAIGTPTPSPIECEVE